MPIAIKKEVVELPSQEVLNDASPAIRFLVQESIKAKEHRNVVIDALDGQNTALDSLDVRLGALEKNKEDEALRKAEEKGKTVAIAWALGVVATILTAVIIHHLTGA